MAIRIHKDVGKTTTTTTTPPLFDHLGMVYSTKKRIVSWGMVFMPIGFTQIKHQEHQKNDVFRFS